MDFTTLPLWANLAVFAVAAAAVWLSGVRLARYAEVIAERTGAGQAFVGALLLGGITSLPEIGTTTTAAAYGDAPLAVNNLIGGVAMQVAVLAVVDALIRRRPISGFIVQPVVLLEGALLIVLLAISAAAIVIGEPEAWPVGPWACAIFVSGIFGFYLVNRYEGESTWRAVDDPARGVYAEREENARRAGDADAAEAAAHGSADDHAGDDGDDRREEKREGEELRRVPMRSIWMRTAAAALVVLVSGFAVARAGEALSQQTGLSSGFVGLALVAISTSLPELSTTLSAARAGHFGLAFSNIFGTNIIDLALVLLADVAYGGAPVLNEVGDFSLVALLLAVVLTGTYIVGLVERPRRALAGMGADSKLVLLLYAAGLVGLYMMR